MDTLLFTLNRVAQNFEERIREIYVEISILPMHIFFGLGKNTLF